jgi:hypothetical protein
LKSPAPAQKVPERRMRRIAFLQSAGVRLKYLFSLFFCRHRFFWIFCRFFVRTPDLPSHPDCIFTGCRRSDRFSGMPHPQRLFDREEFTP